MHLEKICKTQGTAVIDDSASLPPESTSGVSSKFSQDLLQSHVAYLPINLAHQQFRNLNTLGTR
jgi:hypothetical protein